MSAKSMAKSLARRLASPVTKRMYGRIDERAAEIHRGLDGVPAMIDERVAALAAEIEALNRYLPTVINTIASQNASSRETQRQLRAHQQRLDDLETNVRNHATSIGGIFERVEFVRREVLLEQRYRHGSASDTGSPAGHSAQTAVPNSRVTNEQKLRSMQGRLRVNVGAGHMPRADYVNVDSRELPGIDVVADVRHLPFEAEELSEIYSAHLLEHFPVEELRRVILPRWVSMLEDGGKLVAVVPDVQKMVAERAAGRLGFDDFIEVIYGGQEYDGDFHFSGFSKETLAALFEEVGLEDVKVIEEGRQNGACYEMEIEAVRRIPSQE